jgi:hypothetical protein
MDEYQEIAEALMRWRNAGKVDILKELVIRLDRGDHSEYLKNWAKKRIREMGENGNL